MINPLHLLQLHNLPHLSHNIHNTHNTHKSLMELPQMSATTPSQDVRSWREHLRVTLSLVGRPMESVGRAIGGVGADVVEVMGGQEWMREQELKVLVREKHNTEHEIHEYINLQDEDALDEVLVKIFDGLGNSFNGALGDFVDLINNGLNPLTHRNVRPIVKEPKEPIWLSIIDFVHCDALERKLIGDQLICVYIFLILPWESQKLGAGSMPYLTIVVIKWYMRSNQNKATDLVKLDAVVVLWPPNAVGETDRLR
ncbi:hypothetical protein BDN71DRAFT_1437292 [Pleurotus eryngii]|uniref:Uncharacterized protein n=1 Tax=Pleurotus eryngii TaxID=5323 RepID=A0A9P5ZI58_PLEER|nr:hypothetical protein BDN71DRAFT_1437292 [Pleurotus eryngii]